MMLTPAYEIEDPQGIGQTQPAAPQEYQNQDHIVNGYVPAVDATGTHTNEEQHLTESYHNDCTSDIPASDQPTSHPMSETVPPGLGHVVQWLLDNYEIAEGESLPRSTLYTHYQDFCEQINCGHVNPASFGKVIRSVFTGLKTRRLGTRGNSKYHYFGIKIRNDSRLANPHDWSQETGSESDDCRSIDHNSSHSHRKRVHLQSNINGENNGDTGKNIHTKLDHRTELSDFELRAYLGTDLNVSVSNNWRSLNETILMELSSVVPVGTVQLFEAKYREMYDSIMQSLYNLKFDEVENLWCRFWAGSQENQNISDGRNSVLNSDTIHLMTVSSSAFIDWIITVDYLMYAAIEKLLLPNILSPIPRNLAQQIRLFATNLETWMEKAFSPYQNRLCGLKIKVASAFGSTLRRQTGLNHLATATNAVWRNECEIQQMCLDLTRVDMKDIQHQAAMISQCNPYAIEEIIRGFKLVLQDPDPADRWSSWCRELVDFRIDGSDFKVARSFVLRWGFYVDLIIKDLTLRSAPSFGSMHLVRLLLNEYMYYLTVEKLARHQRKTRTQVELRLEASQVYDDA